MPMPPTIRVARPRLAVNGQENPQLAAMLTRMEIREQEDALPSLELNLPNWGAQSNGTVGYNFEDDTLLKLGAQVTVFMADPIAENTIFTGVISGLEGRFPAGFPPELVVRSSDPLQQLCWPKRSRGYVRKPGAAVIKELAASLNLGLVLNASLPVMTEAQLDETDLSFLCRLAVRHSLDVRVTDQKLQVSTRASVGQDPIELTFGNGLRQATVLADLSQQVTKVIVVGTSRVNSKPLTAESIGTPGPALTGRSGSGVLMKTVGEYVERRYLEQRTTIAELRTLADAWFNEHATRFLVANCTAEFTPLRIGGEVSLKSLGPRFSNTYRVLRTCHRFDTSQGLRTEFTARCPVWGGAA